MRALATVALTVGFFVLCIAIVAGLTWASVWSFTIADGVVSRKLGYVTLLLVAGMVTAVFRVLRAKPAAPVGVDLAPDEAPELWELVRGIARQVGTRAPDRLMLDADVNAGVSERSRLLGLLGGKRTMAIGLPLLYGLTVSQLSSILAHEMGHYSRGHTRLAPLAFRSRTIMVSTAHQLRHSVAGWLLRTYAAGAMALSAAFARSQELEADQASVRVAGRANATSALREVVVVGRMWEYFVRRYVTIGWEAGLAPAPTVMFSGFADLLAARPDERDYLRSLPPRQERSRWDSHPPVEQRLASMEACPEGEVRSDDRQGIWLIPRAASVAAAVAQACFAYGDRAQVSWDVLVTRALAEQDQREADVLYRAAAEVLGRPRAGLDDVLRLSEAGRLGEVEERLSLPPSEDHGGILWAIVAGLRAAAIKGGSGELRLSWQDVADVVRPDGVAMDLYAVARAAVDSATVAQARAALTDLGIDVDQATVEQETAPVAALGLRAAVAWVRVNGKLNDALVVNSGLLLRRCPMGTAGTRQRLEDWIAATGAADFEDTEHFLAFSHMSRVVIKRESPVTAEVDLDDGRHLEIKEVFSTEGLTKQSVADFRTALLDCATG